MHRLSESILLTYCTTANFHVRERPHPHIVAKRDMDVLLLATPCKTTESAGRPTADGLQKHYNLTTHFSFAVLELQMLINSRQDLL